MTPEALWKCLCALVTLLTGVSSVVLLTDNWRFSRPKVWALVSLVTTGIVTFHVCCFLLLDVNSADLLATLADAATLLLVPIIARWGRGRLLFTIAVAYSFTFSTVFFSFLFSNQIGPAHLAVRLALAAVCVFYLKRWFAPALHSVFCIDISGWYGLSLLPLLFGLLFFTVTASKFFQGRSSVLTYVPSATFSSILLLLPICAYVVLYQFFRCLTEYYTDFRKRAALSAQVLALELQQANDSRLHYRDELFLGGLRERLDHADTLIRSGDLTEALALAEALEGRVSTSMNMRSACRYCDDPLLNAVLRDYVFMAEAEGIDLSVQFSLPEELVLNTAAMSVVMSNALENAMNACRAQPSGAPRHISLITRNTPVQLFLQIENSCDSPVVFDHTNGYPVSLREGHGYGTRSIAAFALQYNGALRYEWHDGVFALKLLI